MKLSPNEAPIPRNISYIDVTFHNSATGCILTVPVPSLDEGRGQR